MNQRCTVRQETFAPRAGRIAGMARNAWNKLYAYPIVGYLVFAMGYKRVPSDTPLADGFYVRYTPKF